MQNTDDTAARLARIERKLTTLTGLCLATLGILTGAIVGVLI